MKFIQNLLWLPLRFVFWFFLGYRVVGQENYKNLKKPFLIISNHVSNLDPFLLNVAFPIFSEFYPIRYAAKSAIFKSRIQNKPVRFMGGFEVKKKVGLKDSLAYPVEILKNGGVVLIFPTGAREKPRGRPRTARQGTAYLALNTGVPILPVTVRNAKGLKWDWAVFFKRGLKKRRVTVLIGKPFYLSEDFKYPRDIDKATEVIDKTLIKLRRLKVKRIKNFLDLINEWLNEDWLE